MHVRTIRLFTALSVVLLGTTAMTPARADDAQLSAEVAALKQQLAAQQATLDKLQARLDSSQGSAASASTSAGPSTPAGEVPATDTTFGGYGEITYNAYAKDSSRNQADLKRFVIFYGHRFSDQLTFNSEVEWEHAIASATDEGETEIEQAYLNYQFKNGVNLKAGLFLMPFGFLNTSHEPPVFYGVERNLVETQIIPSTWREGGVGLSGTAFDSLTWDVGLTTGFDVAKLDDASAPLAASHQELQLAHAHDLSVYGALNYHGVPGLTVGGAVFSGNTLQGNADFKTDATVPDFGTTKGHLILWDAHARWQSNGWDLQAVYARGQIDQAERIDATIQAYNTANAADRPYVPKVFSGWYIQGAYTVWSQGDMSLAPFVRYEDVDTQTKMPTGFEADPTNANKATTLGFSFKPLPQIVFKADYQSFAKHAENNRYNFGLGYMF